MKFKKVAVMFMAAVMSLSVLAGCGGSGSGSGTASGGKSTEAGGQTGQSDAGGADSSGSITFPLSEKLELTGFAMLNSDAAVDDTLTWKKMEEMGNIDVEFQNVLGADIAEKRNLLLNTGEYPDIFMKSGFSLADCDKYGAEGILLPLEDAIHEYMPNLSRILDERDGWQFLASTDGHIYSLPEIDRQEGSGYTYWINKKWMNNLNLAEPTSFEELFDVLKAFKEQDANGNGNPDDEIPLSIYNGISTRMLLQYSTDFCYDVNTNTAVIDGKMAYLPVTDTWKWLLGYTRDMYEAGILDPASFTQSSDEMNAKGTTEDVMGSFFMAGAFLTVGRDNDDDYIALKPFADGFPIGTGIVPGTFTLTDKCDPELVPTILAWMDYLYSEEGGMLAWMGVENETYFINDEGDWEWKLDGSYGDDVSKLRSTATIQGAAYHPSVIPDFWYSNMSPNSDPDEVYLNSERDALAANGKVALPAMTFTEEETTQRATLMTDLDAYVNQYMAQVATGEVDLDSTWDEYLSTMDAMGAQELQDIYQASYDRATQ